MSLTLLVEELHDRLDRVEELLTRIADALGLDPVAPTPLAVVFDGPTISLEPGHSHPDHLKKVLAAHIAAHDEADKERENDRLRDLDNLFKMFRGGR